MDSARISAGVRENKTIVCKCYETVSYIPLKTRLKLKKTNRCSALEQVLRWLSSCNISFFYSGKLSSFWCVTWPSAVKCIQQFYSLRSALAKVRIQLLRNVAVAFHEARSSCAAKIRRNYEVYSCADKSARFTSQQHQWNCCRYVVHVRRRATCFHNA